MREHSSRYQQRTFRGRQMHKILERVRLDMGEDAEILETKRSSSGEFLVQARMSLEPEADLSVLEDAGVSEQILKEVRKLQRVSGADDFEAVKQVALRHINFVFKLCDKRKAIALVGPTGVGKTTSIAKLAAQFSKACGLKVALIAADNYRVGAGFQLQTYASLLGIPCAAPHPKRELSAELERLLERFSSYDLVLIDTAGSNPRATEDFKTQILPIAERADVEPVGVLSASYNVRDFKRYREVLRELGAERLLLSKLDETGYFGPVLSTLIEEKETLAFVTNGQRVPEDIEPASARRLAWMLKERIH